MTRSDTLLCLMELGLDFDYEKKIKSKEKRL